MTVAASHRAEQLAEATSWPFDLPHEPTLKIGEVQDALIAEFPMLALSKIRHYESEELIHPHRTASNQRLFSVADCERLRFILREQRDRYLPLAQIRELLHQLDSGVNVDGSHASRMRVLDQASERPQPGTRLTVQEVSELTGVPVGEIASMVDAGVLATDPRGRLTSQAPEIARFASMLLADGMDMRQVRSIRTSAHAHAVMVTSDVSLSSGNTIAAERAIAAVAEKSNVISQLYRALLTENVEVELR